MKRLLILADLGHASPRIPGIAEFLPAYGWSPTIVTPWMNSGQRTRFLSPRAATLNIVETAGFRMEYGRVQGLAGRAARRIGRVMGKAVLRDHYQYPDGHHGWIGYARRTAQIEAQRCPIDAVMSSSSPVSAHIAAAQVAAEHSLPWCADLRDLWTQNHNYAHGARRLQQERELELRTLASAHALTTVTPQWCKRLTALHEKPVQYLPNGYYEAGTPRPKLLGDPVRIVYTGQIYPRYQRLESVVHVLESLNREAARTAYVLELYGAASDHAHRLYGSVARLRPSSLKLMGCVSRDESYRAQKDADLLLLLNWEDKNEKGVAPTKLYEYFAAGRAIIATGGHGNDFVQDTIRNTNTGFYCRTREELADVLRTLAPGKPSPYSPREGEVGSFSYNNIAKRLSSVLDSLVARDADSNSGETI